MKVMPPWDVLWPLIMLEYEMFGLFQVTPLVCLSLLRPVSARVAETRGLLPFDASRILAWQFCSHLNLHSCPPHILGSPLKKSQLLSLPHMSFWSSLYFMSGEFWGITRQYISEFQAIREDLSKEMWSSKCFLFFEIFSCLLDKHIC